MAFHSTRSYFLSCRHCNSCRLPFLSLTLFLAVGPILPLLFFYLGEDKKGSELLFATYPQLVGYKVLDRGTEVVKGKHFSILFHG